jgi:hypothetical protein
MPSLLLLLYFIFRRELIFYLYLFRRYFRGRHTRDAYCMPRASYANVSVSIASQRHGLQNDVSNDCTALRHFATMSR